jgi:hypothetical protein
MISIVIKSNGIMGGIGVGLALGHRKENFANVINNIK